MPTSSNAEERRRKFLSILVCNRQSPSGWFLASLHVQGSCVCHGCLLISTYKRKLKRMGWEGNWGGVRSRGFLIVFHANSCRILRGMIA